MIKASSGESPDFLPVAIFRYALRLADSIQIQVYAINLKYAKTIYNMMQLASLDLKKKVS